MARVYSKRLLLPYVGVVQVVDLGWARALSMDGTNWAIRYTQDENRQTLRGSHSHDPRVNLAMIVTIEAGQFKTRIMRPRLDRERLHVDSQRIFDKMSSLQVPFEAADRYEYWLLDASDESPLALLHTCVTRQEMAHPVPLTGWLSIPAAELAVPDPYAEAGGNYIPPVNYRLQEFIEQRAGSKPRAAWFEREQPATDDFPPCLIKTEWEDPASQQLCDLYLLRLAPRLLMMGGLPRTVRQRLEQAACDYVFDVEKYYPLYPEVVDNNLLNTARVEARLRRTNEAVQ